MLDAQFSPPDNLSLTRYQVGLSENPPRGWWMYKPSGTPPAHKASEAEIKRVFEDVQELQIRGEFIHGDDWAYLDEVELTRPD